MSIIIFIIILAILILVHEFGHFIVAKKSGIRVDEFGLGFPPKLWSKKFGETLYTLNAIPFGGFVKIFGEDPHAETISEVDKPTSFYYKPKWIQALVLVAGVSFNIIFAWLVISLGFMIGLPTPAEYAGLGHVTDTHLVVTEILPNSPADKAGIKSGDELTAISAGGNLLNYPSLSVESVKKFINGSDKPIEVQYKRGDNFLGHSVIKPTDNIVSGRRVIGIAMESIGVLKLPPHLALLEGARTTWVIIKGTTVGLGKFLWDAVRLKSDFSQISGPVGIASVVGQAQSLGFVYLLTLVALISINLAVINLLPFPALDGGRLLFIGIEAVIRRPIAPAFVRWSNTVGFALLIILMLVVTGHDIFKLL